MSDGDIGEGRHYETEEELYAPSRILGDLGHAGKRAERLALKAALEATIRREVVPRLVKAKNAEIGVAASIDRSVTAGEISHFRKALLKENADVCAGLVEAFRQSGVSQHTVYLGLFAPVARQLGELWDADDLNFVDVSIAMGRLQSLLNQMSDPAADRSRDEKRCIVLAAAPGDHHALGLSIVGEFFHMAGWQVAGGATLEAGPDLATAVRDTWFAVAGLSASTEEKAKTLGGNISALRRSSCNRRITVIVGGHGFDAHPEISRLIGADGIASDGAKAVAEAERLFKAAYAKPTR